MVQNDKNAIPGSTASRNREARAAAWGGPEIQSQANRWICFYTTFTTGEIFLRLAYGTAQTDQAGHRDIDPRLLQCPSSNWALKPCGIDSAQKVESILTFLPATSPSQGVIPGCNRRPKKSMLFSIGFRRLHLGGYYKDFGT